MLHYDRTAVSEGIDITCVNVLFVFIITFLVGILLFNHVYAMVVIMYDKWLQILNTYYGKKEEHAQSYYHSVNGKEKARAYYKNNK